MTSTQKIYLSTVIFLILIILLIIFLIHPLFKEIKKNSQTFLLEKEKMISLAKERENLKKMEDIYKAYQLDLAKIENLFVDSEVPIEIIIFLEKNASNTQVQLGISSMTKKVEKGDPWPSLSLQLLVTGSFPNFLEFLEKLENGPYLIETLNLNVKKLTEKETASKEFENIPSTDTSVSLLIKVFTK